MQGAVVHARFTADIFHDVDLAAFWPAVAGYVVAEHPERRPDALTLRDFNACFEAAKCLRKKVLCFQPCGSVITLVAIRAGEFFLLSSDDQIAALDFHIPRM